MNTVKTIKSNFIAAGVILLILLFIVGAASFGSYKYAGQKFTAQIAEQQQQIEDLKNDILVSEKAAQEVNIDNISSDIRNIGELATMEYLYTNADRYDDSRKIFGHNIFGTQKSIILKYDGVIKAGIDVTQTTIDISKIKKTITVTIPAAVILSHEIDEKKAEILHEDSNVWNRIKADDMNKLYGESKEFMKNRAIENGLLEKAEANAKDIITKMIESAPNVKGNYTIEFKLKA